MESGATAISAAQEALRTAVVEQFRTAAAARGLTLSDRPPSVILQHGLLVAAVACVQDRDSGGGPTAVGLIHLSTPVGQPDAFLTTDRVALQGGEYLIELDKRASVSLRGTGEGSPIPVSDGISALEEGMPDGKAENCDDPRIEVRIDAAGNLCFYFICDWLWYKLLFCLMNPVRVYGGLLRDTSPF
jgi:hypothetical protein